MLVSHRKRTVGWIAGGVMAVTIAGVTGCSSDSDSAADKKPTASSSAAADGQETEEGTKTDGPAASKPSVGDQSTAEGAIAAWVTAVIKGQPKEACLLMGEPAAEGAPAEAGGALECRFSDRLGM